MGKEQVALSLILFHHICSVTTIILHLKILHQFIKYIYQIIQILYVCMCLSCMCMRMSVSVCVCHKKKSDFKVLDVSVVRWFDCRGREMNDTFIVKTERTKIKLF